MTHKPSYDSRDHIDLTRKPCPHCGWKGCDECGEHKGEPVWTKKQKT